MTTISVATRLVVAPLLVACGGPPPADHAAGHPGAHPHPHGHRHAHADHHDFSDTERFASMFDDPERDAWQRPDEVVRHLEIGSEMTVADLGAGTGYFERRLAPVSARVLALDGEPNMIEHLRARAEREGWRNVEARRVEPGDPGLPPASVDRILVVDTWHHLADRAAYARRLREALRPGGFVLVVDFTLESPHGPPPPMRVAAEQVIAELREGGLDARVIDEALPYQWIVRAARR
ncbi:MAG: class I SAM-dependent methyltransferase [Sandaracinaceae bacterium]|nr:class I SAM-dependent methyltransferase [Sandaracinaceae bacterium]